MGRITASQALQDLVVLDLTRVRAGPTCSRVLADFGADVIRIEAPDGIDPNEGVSGPRHGYDMQNLHRNKRSLSLNLKLPAGRKAFLRMVERADVVVENYRPDVKTRLGLDYASLSAINPRIILASVSGFGQHGPAANQAGFDQIAQGMGGLMWITGESGSGPMRAGAAIADSSAGLYAAIGILVAIAERARSGHGQWIHTSLLEAQIAICDFQAARYLVDGVAPAQAGNDHPYLTPMGVLPTSDGFVNVGVGGQRQWQAFCDAIGQPELATHADYATVELRFANRPALRAHLEPIFKTATSRDWMQRLEAAHVPAGPIYKMDEVFADPQVKHLGIAQPVHHPARGDIRLVGEPVTLTRTPAMIVTAAPDKGEHSDEVLSEFGFSADEISALRTENVV